MLQQEISDYFIFAWPSSRGGLNRFFDQDQLRILLIKVLSENE